LSSGSVLSAPSGQVRVGELLVSKGLLTREGLRHALEVQIRTGDRLGAVLMSLGLVKRQQLYETLAELWGHPFVDLMKSPPARDVARRFDSEVLVAKRFIPLAIAADGHLVHVATADAPSPEIESLCQEVLGPEAEVKYWVTTDWDIDKALVDVFREELLATATMGLYHRSPEESAYRPFRKWQLILAGLATTLLILGLVLATLPTVVVLSAVVNLAFLGAIAFKVATSIAGVKAEHSQVITEDDLSGLNDRDLPTYTILVPVFREANIVAKLMDNLRQLDYPASKLEVLLLIEEEDEETLEAARAARPPETVTFVIVPAGMPRTKPRACNVGLFFAKGEYLVIYDAEDRPEPDQLRKAVLAFQRGDDKLICVQAALNYYNRNENFLTRMFTLEYSYWFDYMLPGLDRLKLPIPLGGTSNHFRTEALRKLSGWDPFNVTEDADLGIRASAEGYRVGVINSTTFEEANNDLGNWIRQRSRWIKGYMQTTLVHLRNPVSLTRRVGAKNAVAFALLIGGTPLVFLFALPMWIFFAIWLVSGLPPEAVYPSAIGYVGWFNLLLGNALMIALNMLGVGKRGYYGLLVWTLANPFYWLLHSIASYRALWQLITRPFYWEKTDHGISKHADEGYPRPVPMDSEASSEQSGFWAA
jgi:glycosyltransferase XagB